MLTHQMSYPNTYSHMYTLTLPGLYLCTCLVMQFNHLPTKQLNSHLTVPLGRQAQRYRQLMMRSLYTGSTTYMNRTHIVRNTVYSGGHVSHPQYVIPDKAKTQPGPRSVCAVLSTPGRDNDRRSWQDGTNRSGNRLDQRQLRLQKAIVSRSPCGSGATQRWESQQGWEYTHSKSHKDVFKGAFI